jgi:tetratricopeptide (TPR) repeat protein
MKPNFRTCPQCSTRNRLDKEFCVKCGEPLEGVKAGDPALAPTLVGKKGKPGFSVSTGGDEAQSPLVPFILVLLVLAVAFGAWRVVQEGGPAPNAGRAAAPVKPAPVPPVAAATMAPGVAEYTAGMAALRAANYPEAIRLLRAAVAAADKADHRLGLAEALEKSGAMSDALVEYEAAAGLDSANVRYISDWAKALYRAGRATEAIQAYEAALQLDGDNVANLKEIANLLIQGNDFARARPHLQKVVAIQPDDLAPKQSLARALDATGDLEGATQQYRDILAAMPEAHLSRALLSDLLMRRNRPAEAIALLDQGLAADPNAGLLHREKGRVYDRLGRGAEAVASYREYVRLSPGANDVRTFTDRINQLAASAGQ